MPKIDIIKQHLNRLINKKLNLSLIQPLKPIQRLSARTRPMFHKLTQTINIIIKQEQIENKE